MCQLDTGATCNVLNTEYYKALTSESDTNLKQSSVHLNFEATGYATLYTRINGKNFKLGYVLDGKDEFCHIKLDK